jgi:hypothetical protein
VRRMTGVHSRNISSSFLVAVLVVGVMAGLNAAECPPRHFDGYHQKDCYE